jgi:uncharacterized protein (DUF433 family)
MLPVVHVTGSTRELGRGVYAAGEAARIARLTSSRVHRWLRGYTFKGRDGREHWSGPVFQREHAGESLALTFADLVELLFVKGFLDEGVPMHVVRTVHTEASREFETRHPFTQRRFEHDGRTIIERVRSENGEELLVDRYRAQHLLVAVMQPLVRKLAYDTVTLEARRYFPLGADRSVVIDPRRAFGEASIERRGVPTRVLFRASRSGESAAAIARWYGVELHELEAALQYERALRERQAA